MNEKHSEIATSYKRTINSKYNRVVAIAKNFLVRKDKICEDDDDDDGNDDDDDDDDDDTNSHSQSFYKIALKILKISRKKPVMESLFY